ncbi:MAG: fumarylacetoacetate hydrolase family protein [Candidatus Hydrogenedentes bacterium]|nr:fumarylacetoacetate hydrolase family protein [Candidatus Hydrogenedentota bacterium]
MRVSDAHIAAGANFTAHAEESAVEDGPFLFAKLVRPTPFNAPVRAGTALLDYEVELAYVTLSDTTLPGVPAHMGLLLANDFTDRATLMRHVNPSDVTTGDGFATGKSAEGYLPVGNLFVIPKDLESFTANIDLKLAVNGALRQSGRMTLAVWDLPELLRQTEAGKTPAGNTWAPRWDSPS